MSFFQGFVVGVLFWVFQKVFVYLLVDTQIIREVCGEDQYGGKVKKGYGKGKRGWEGKNGWEVSVERQGREREFRLGRGCVGGFEGEGEKGGG